MLSCAICGEEESLVVEHICPFNPLKWKDSATARVLEIIARSNKQKPQPGLLFTAQEITLIKATDNLEIN